VDADSLKIPAFQVEYKRVGVRALHDRKVLPLSVGGEQPGQAENLFHIRILETEAQKQKTPRQEFGGEQTPKPRVASLIPLKVASGYY
jgi:hypothetical protein